MNPIVTSSIAVSLHLIAPAKAIRELSQYIQEPTGNITPSAQKGKSRVLTSGFSVLHLSNFES
jgi:hypothetical protein